MAAPETMLTARMGQRRARTTGAVMNMTPIAAANVPLFSGLSTSSTPAMLSNTATTMPVTPIQRILPSDEGVECSTGAATFGVVSVGRMVVKDQETVEQLSAARHLTPTLDLRQRGVFVLAQLGVLLQQSSQPIPQKDIR